MTTESFNGEAALEALCKNILNTRFEDLDPATVDNTKRRILDMLGCGIGGAAAPGNGVLAEIARAWGNKGEATILGHGIKGPAHEVAMINCIQGRSFDWGPLVVIQDDGLRHASHNSETTVLTAVTMAEAAGVNGKELITALVVGDDFTARVHMGGGGGHPGRMPTAPPAGMRRGGGFDEWGTKTTFGATAIAGRLLGLNLKQMKNAFGIAINMMAGAGGGLMEGANTFKLSQGTAARSGINAAQLAKGGWVGIKDPLSSYYNTFTGGCHHPEMITDRVGKKYYVEVVFKPWPGGRPTSNASQLATTMAQKYDINPDDVVEAIYRTSEGIATAAHYTKPYKVGDYPTGDSLFSFVYAIANGIVNRESKNENFTDEVIRNPKTQALIKRVTLASLNKPEGVELEIRMKDGRVFNEYLRMAIGDPSVPFTREMLLAKFMNQVNFSKLVSRQNAAKIIELVEGLEKVDNVREIVALSGKKG